MIFALVVIVAAILAVYYFSLVAPGSSVKNEWKKTVSAFREKEDTRASRPVVHMQKGDIEDLFTRFPQAESAYVSEEEVALLQKRMKEMERESVKAVAPVVKPMKPTLEKVAASTSTLTKSVRSKSKEEAHTVE